MAAAFAAQPSPARKLRQARQGQIAFDRMIEHEPLQMPVFRHERDAAPDGVGGAAYGERLAVDLNSACLDRQQCRRSFAEFPCDRCRSVPRGRGSSPLRTERFTPEAASLLTFDSVSTGRIAATAERGLMHLHARSSTASPRTPGRSVPCLACIAA